MFTFYHPLLVQRVVHTLGVLFMKGYEAPCVCIISVAL